MSRSSCPPAARRAARRAAAAVLATALGLAVVGCGIPAEDRAHVIADDDLPFGLAASTTVTTSGVGINPVIPPVETEVVLYFLTKDERMVQVVKALDGTYSLTAVVNALATEEGDAQKGYRSAVRTGDVLSVQLRGGVATVELDETFKDLPNLEQGRAVAQLVLTLTSQPGVGQILFKIGGDRLVVPRADGTLGDTALTQDDFIELVGTVPTTTTAPDHAP